MFRDDAHKAEAIRVLLRKLSLDRFWGDLRPTEEAFGDLAGLSSGEVTLLRVALDIWAPQNRGAPLGDITQTLDLDIQIAIFWLMLAINSGDDGSSIDRWVRNNSSV
jgi:hypothetical protein